MSKSELSPSDSSRTVPLSVFRANKRVAKITIAVGPDACASGRAIQGTYHKDMTPRIPVEECSRPGGCNCQYMPVLKDISP